MSIQAISFMGVKPGNGIVKKAAEKAEALKEEAIYYGKEPMGEATKALKENFRPADLESYVNSRKTIGELPQDVSAEELAEAYKAAHGILK